MNDVLKTMQEICKYYGDDCERNGKRCPFDGLCLHVPADWDAGKFDQAKRAVEEWKNPKYPTWGQWLCMNGYMTPFFQLDETGHIDNTIARCILTDKAKERIPEDIAEMLNIDPFEPF